ncbi:MAG: DUF362 domain-containing protein [Candidatus Nitrohelix vancouverensis]|uniref:DUF362 domain-containing protein n=1 Tax=Candidatus Nitrohelix vancouverensis TaxID=2705534 RepID=A0A7T0C2F0_9BACT|nr:MAG: DUF362 domain-containing protein [Candidatus Nitrohelix vancouverensis]
MKSKVVLKKQADYDLNAIECFIRDSVDRLFPDASPFKPGDRVLLKPNLLRSATPEQCVTTHPVILEAMCRVLKDFGVRSITISDSPAMGSLNFVARQAGYEPLVKTYGAQITPLSRPTDFESLEKIPHLKIAGCLDDYDHVVNLPKVKSHRQMTVTLSIKNLFGLVIGKRKPVLHCLVQNDKVKFGRMLVEIAQKVNPTLTVVDGVQAMQGNGPMNGTPFPLGVVCAGRDQTAVDRVMTEILPVPLERMYVLTAAEQLKFGQADMAQIQLVGETDLQLLRAEDFKLADRPLDISFNPLRLAKSCFKQFVELAFKERWAKSGPA